MKTIHLELEERSYNIRIGTGLDVGGALKDEKGIKALMVSDSNVDPLYGDRFQKILAENGIETVRMVVPAGEKSKDLSVVKKVYDAAFSAKLDRKSVIVALGGGVIGDLSGFAAATFLRGIRFIQVPTSLLAMVDSSVGGKTGVNVEQGKNLVGAFYQPVDVAIDLSTLSTLPEREYVSGLAEVVKYGVIWDAEFFTGLESGADSLLGRDPAVLESVIARSCEIKAEVVAMDEREGGVRAILNFGHTMGHAVEKCLGYGSLLHGEAVSIGMVYAAELSRLVKGMPDECNLRVRSLLEKFGLPVGLDKAALNWAELREAMCSDKKSRGQVPRFVLAERTGAVVFGCEVDEELLEQAFLNMTGS